MVADIDQLILLLSIPKVQNLGRNIMGFEMESILIIISYSLKHIEKRGDELQVTRTIWETYAALANIAWLASRGRVMS